MNTISRVQQAANYGVSLKAAKRGKREETENVRTKTKSAESSQPLV